MQRLTGYPGPYEFQVGCPQRNGSDLKMKAHNTVVYGKAGGDVLLPCNFTEDPKGDLKNLTISWEYIISSGTNKVVHSYHELKDYPEHQDVQFKGRTKLFHSELKKRNTSLLLRNLAEADQGEYLCLTEPYDVQRYYIFLNVTEEPGDASPKEPSNDLTGIVGGGIGICIIIGIIIVCVHKK
ncbi:myelin-oligodendrocyte glycoprotein-like [Latimeria chalumnae]|uniref:myelin-oligodendrocyte glycoprotein-like n=1 Tax=Latimeria chalumnae TaxID=7897 RepID=UPI00313ABC5A